MKTLFKLVSIFFYLSLTTVLAAEQSDAEYDGTFISIENPEDFIATELNAAQTENKKLLFVLGGNWCHDSRSLAKKLDDKDLSRFIQDNYRLSFIDVGYLNQAFEFTAKANMQTFYATPTVLIFDPKTQQHINAEDMHIWANAAKLSQEDTHAYFKKYALLSEHRNTQELTSEQKEQLLKLKQFIAVQEQRIKSSYKILGPMLERYKAKDEDENFQSYWEALAKLRSSLPADTKKLHSQIISASESEVQQISFPVYTALPWEKTADAEADSATE